MKYVIVIAIAVVILIFWMMKSQSASPGSEGFLSDIPHYLEALLRSDDPHTFLIVTQKSSGDFLQFTAGKNSVQMDFPLITEQQKNKADQLKKTCSSLGLSLEENTGSGGQKFFDWNLTGTPDEMFQVISSVFVQTFGVKPEDQLIFQHDGLTIR